MTTRWAIAATGGMAAAFATDLALVPDAELAFVGSRTAKSAADFARRFGASGSGTHHDLLAAARAGEVDVVYVATPHPQHHALALAVIGTGTAVLVEKAFTATLAGAEQVVSAARAAEVFCMEAMWTRFQPVVAHLREIVTSGEIGEVLLVQGTFCAQRDYDPASRLFDLSLGGGSVLDLGVYPVSFAQHLLGRPDRVTATGTLFPNGADASAAIHLGYDDGRAAALTCSLAAAVPDRTVVVGSRGSVEVEPPAHGPSRIVVRRNGSSPETVERTPTGRGYVHQAEEVQRCLAAGLTESPVMPLSDTLDVMWVLEESLSQLGVTMSEATLDL